MAQCRGRGAGYMLSSSVLRGVRRRRYDLASSALCSPQSLVAGMAGLFAIWTLRQHFVLTFVHPASESPTANIPHRAIGFSLRRTTIHTTATASSPVAVILRSRQLRGNNLVPPPAAVGRSGNKASDPYQTRLFMNSRRGVSHICLRVSPTPVANAAFSSSQIFQDRRAQVDAPPRRNMEPTKIFDDR